MKNIYKGLNTDPTLAKKKAKDKDKEKEEKNQENQEKIENNSENDIEFLKDANIRTFNELLSYMLHQPKKSLDTLEIK